MEIKVTRRFYDKENGLKLCVPGDTLNVSQQRGKELTDKGLAEAVTKPNTKN